MMAAGDCNSWGRLFRPTHGVYAIRDRFLPLPDFPGSALPYGVGRSYGDSCLNDGQALLHARSLDRFMAFDPDTGVLRCEAGVLLSEIVAFALPRGFFLPVTPGTKFVTVGGAIANDVHGKNHHRDGSIGHHVPRFELLRSDRSRRVCSPTENTALYRATIGGLGLTGLVTWAEIRLAPVRGPWMRQRVERFAGLRHFFELCDPLEREHRYVVAWLDCAARGRSAGRGILFAGDHDDSRRPLPRRGTRTFPFNPPFSLVNGPTARLFNALYYRAPRNAGRHGLVTYESFFYPLDSVLHWNRVYGRRGFFQYQCVVPEGEAGQPALEEILGRIAQSGQGSFLAVLKRFGSMPPAGLLSFPRAGYTLALDFPNLGSETMNLLEALDRCVIDAGGSVYPAKDARMSSAAFRAFFPMWESFAEHVDPRFSSSFWRRVTGHVNPGLEA